MGNILLLLDKLNTYCVRYYATGGDIEYYRLYKELKQAIVEKDKEIDKLRQRLEGMWEDNSQ